MRKVLAVAVALWAGTAGATVTGTLSTQSYTCSGGTSYPVPFRFMDKSHLILTKTDLAGTETTLALVTDYTVVQSPTGGTVTLTSGAVCPANYSLRIERLTPKTQPTSLRTQGTFSPATHENAFDRMVMQIQDLDRADADVRADFNSLEGFVNGLTAGTVLVAPKTWAFTGDGVATTYVITGNDISDALSYIVSIDGVVQYPGIDYTVSASSHTITFTSAPPLGAAGAIRCLTYAKQAPAVNDASTITATGSVTARSLAARAAEVANVKDYGALCDGATNDAAAFALAQAAAGTNGVVSIPAGTCVIGTTLQHTTSGVTFRGAGMYSTTLKLTGGSFLFDSNSVGVRGVAFEDIGFNGNSTGQSVLHFRPGSGRVRVSRCYFYGVGTPGAGIYNEGSRDFLFESNVFKGEARSASGNAISLGGGATAGKIVNNTIKFPGYGGISVFTIGANDVSEGIVIEGNHIDGGWWFAPAVYSHSGGTVTYAANSLTDTGQAWGSPTGYARAMAALASGAASATYDASGLNDSSASFVAAGVSKGFVIVRTATATGVVTSATATQVAVEEWVSTATLDPVSPPAAGTAYTVYRLRMGKIVGVAGNVLTVAGWPVYDGSVANPAAGTLYEITAPPPTYQGIYLQGNVRKAVVRGNVIRRSWADSIAVFGQDNTIADNTIEDGQDMGITLQRVASPLIGRNSVVGNTVRHNGTSGITNVTTDDNAIVGNLIIDNLWSPHDVTLGEGGVSVHGSNRVLISGNKIRKETSGRSHNVGIGVDIVGGAIDGNVVSGNEISGSESLDISIYGGDRTTVVGNRYGTLSVAGGGAISGFSDIRNSGSPEGVVSADQGAIFRRTDGAAATTFYIKTGGYSNTGWIAK
jgi:hypothetical protein